MLALHAANSRKKSKTMLGMNAHLQLCIGDGCEGEGYWKSLTQMGIKVSSLQMFSAEMEWKANRNLIGKLSFRRTKNTENFPGKASRSVAELVSNANEVVVKLKSLISPTVPTRNHLMIRQSTKFISIVSCWLYERLSCALANPQNLFANSRQSSRVIVE